jgi:hypothetical protein
MKTRLSRRPSSSNGAAAHGERVQRRSASSERSAAQLQASDRMAAQRRQVEAAFGSTAQRAGPEEELQMKTVQRAPMEEELPAQGKFADPVQRAEDEELLQGRFAAPVQAKADENQTGMPDGLKSGIESMSGMDMSEVRVHRNSDKPAQLNALAYAQGNDIHLGPGQETHLPHEAWHVVQQRQGRVQATMDLGGVGINDDKSLEGEADAMGAQAVRSGSERA